MEKSEIIKQAKHYFGKDKTFIKDLILNYEFNGNDYRKWTKEIKSIIPNPTKIQYGIFNDLVSLIEENKIKEINWNWIGDLSWTIDILLNENINSGYDWDKKLALKCNSTARILVLFISDVIPCYTYDYYYMTYNKRENYWEFGPILNLTTEEKNILNKTKTLLKDKGFQFVGKEYCEKKFKELYSDTNTEGNASLFDVLFSDTNFYTTEIKRICDKEIIEKNGQKFRWAEYYNKNGILKERIESRWTSAGDYLKVVLDNKSQITQIEVTREKIGRKKFQNFKFDIGDEYRKLKHLKS